MQKKLKIKIFTAILLILLLACYMLSPKDRECYIKEILSPVEFQLDSGENIILTNIQTFDSTYSEKNKKLAKSLGISENEAFIIGNLAKYWTENLLLNREVIVENNDIIYYRYSYLAKLKLSPFGITDDNPTNKKAFDKLVKSIRKIKYGILVDDKLYSIAQEYAKGDYIVIRKSHFYKLFPQKHHKHFKKNQAVQKFCFRPFVSGNIKVIVSDLTIKLIPDRNCSSDICKEILTNIENSKTSIDIAIYGYSSTPKIEKAIYDAQKRGVKLRLIYDTDSKGQNIYPDTTKFVSMIAENKSDMGLKEANATMHNKFYIFDNKIVITGSANLSHTDMSGYNSNNIIVINSAEVAKIYKQEFDQMFSGKFHSLKSSTSKPELKNMTIYFSPQDKPITNGVLPIIKNAKKYIYIPIFVITENRVVEELINAHNRGVDVKLISDALNASSKYSKIRTLRLAGIPVKIENYAGKMHSKTMIVDDKYVIMGSMNFSKSGENKNDENTIILENIEVANYLKTFFLYQWNQIPNKWLKFYPKAESLDSIGSCYDGIDNDYDGLIDMLDDGCKKK